MDIDGKRWWDLRDIGSVYHLFRGVDNKESLPSDATKRADSVTLLTGDQVQAQAEKEAIEIRQRADKALRVAAQKRRDNGGPKYAAKQE